MKPWLCCVTCLAVVPSALPAQTQPVLNPVHWSAESHLPPAMHTGSRFSVLLHASIDDGWHLYALPGTDAFPLATEVALAKNPFADLLRVDEEKPHHTVVDQSHVVTAWFAQATTFTLHLAALTDTQSPFQVLVRYEACNERLCLPARSVAVPVQLMR